MASLHGGGNNGSVSAPAATARHRRGGGWMIIATIFGVTVAGGGWSANLIVFLIEELKMKRMDAAQINNVVNGCINFFPLVAAVGADSRVGCFSVIWMSTVVSLVGLILLVLTVTLGGACRYAVLYSGMGLASIGMGGTRFTLATMGANQFPNATQQATFFNWYFFSLYTASFISSTGIVYVEDNLGWLWGFGIAIAANALSLALFLLGAPYYTCHQERAASPFTGLLRVPVAALRNRNRNRNPLAADYYYGDAHAHAHAPTNSLRQLNRAALKVEGEMVAKGSWKVCTVEEVEDLKSIIRILPLWSSSIFLGTPIGVQLSLTVLQSLASDRRITPSFTFPASSIIVFSFLSTALAVVLIDRCLRPAWRKMTGNALTPLQQIGVGHVFNIASMGVSALVESRRRRHLISVAWLVPQMVVVGVGEAFHFPGQVALYYQEFPASLKGVATAMVAMLVGVAFYLSTAVVDFIRRVTHWLPDDIDHGSLHYVYWLMLLIAILNFAYFLLISCFYHYTNAPQHVVTRDDHKP